MPLIRVEIREGWSSAEKVRLLDAIHAAAVEALRIPDEDRTQISTEHPTDAFEIPPGKGDKFPLVEITMSVSDRLWWVLPSAGPALSSSRNSSRRTSPARTRLPPCGVRVVNEWVSKATATATSTSTAATHVPDGE